MNAAVKLSIPNTYTYCLSQTSTPTVYPKHLHFTWKLAISFITHTTHVRVSSIAIKKRQSSMAIHK